MYMALRRDSQDLNVNCERNIQFWGLAQSSGSCLHIWGTCECNSLTELCFVLCSVVFFVFVFFLFFCFFCIFLLPWWSDIFKLKSLVFFRRKKTQKTFFFLFLWTIVFCPILPCLFFVFFFVFVGFFFVVVFFFGNLLANWSEGSPVLIPVLRHADSPSCFRPFVCLILHNALQVSNLRQPE